MGEGQAGLCCQARNNQEGTVLNDFWGMSGGAAVLERNVTSGGGERRGAGGEH